ncbi:phage tail protein [Vibrio vulnificus]|uniref:phage tail-collar fiber domain-containing protein n=1 Tax=Vibrio vulnificus TaxID=672 RepID=UPI004058F1A6
MANTTDKSILTAAGKALLAQLNAEEKPLIIDKMIFANVPNRPEYPQPDDVVPTDHVVHQEGVEQRGRLTADSVIYSTTLTSGVGPFEFNWTGAYCSEHGVLVTIDHHALTPKTADEPGVAGNTLVRSVVLEYKDIAEITNITVDASSWQYNATPRMKKMDDDVAQAIIDQNGKDWFIEDGFLVTPSGSAYSIKAGAGYVSGNRVAMEFDRSVQVPNKPSFIYIDAHREGTPTGEQVTLFDFVITAEEKDDYIDSSTGKDVKHFVCKIAQVLADGSVSDLRPEGGSASKYYVNKKVGSLSDTVFGGHHGDASGIAFVETFVSTMPLFEHPDNWVSDSDPYVVIGKKGSRTLTSSDSRLTGWGDKKVSVCLLLASGVWQWNMVTNVTPTTVELEFPLKDDVTLMQCKYNAARGQHLSEHGTYAYADHVYDTPAMRAVSKRFFNECTVQTPPSVQTAVKSNQAVIDYGRSNMFDVVTELNPNGNRNIIDFDGHPIRPASWTCGLTQGVHKSGHGITIDEVVNGEGYVEFSLGGYTTDKAGGVVKRSNLRVRAYSNEHLIYDENHNYWCHQVFIPFVQSERIRVEIELIEDDVMYIDISQLKIYKSEFSLARLIDRDSRVVTLGDSWFEWYDGGFARRLQSRMLNDGGTGKVINHAKGGMTTKWALAWFNEYVVKERPDVVVFNFFTNDFLDLKDATFTDPLGNEHLLTVQDEKIWEQNIYKLCALAIENGIRPVVIKPCGTASVGQNQGHGNHATLLNKGEPVQEMQVVSEEAVNDPSARVNLFGKRLGKSVFVGGEVYHAEGPEPDAPWSNKMANRVGRLEANTYVFSSFDTVPFDIDNVTDGLAAGFSLQSYGDNTGSTFTPRVQNGLQYLHYDRQNTGNVRLKLDANSHIQVGDVLIHIVHIENADYTAEGQGSMEVLSDLSGSGKVIDSGSIESDGTWKSVGRWEAGVTSGYLSVGCRFLDGHNPYEFGVRDMYLINLSAIKRDLGIDYLTAPIQVVYSSLMAALNLIPPKLLRITDVGTNQPVDIYVENGDVKVK